MVDIQDIVNELIILLKWMACSTLTWEIKNNIVHYWFDNKYFNIF